MRPIVLAHMRRIAMIVISLIVVLSTATPIARVDAQAPPTDVDNPFPDRIEGLCKFPVRIDASGKMGRIDLPRGGFIATAPNLTATVTNLDNPENQVTLNVTGSSTVTQLEDGTTQAIMTGRNLFFDPQRWLRPSGRAVEGGHGPASK
jgi:hypothetical protein